MSLRFASRQSIQTLSRLPNFKACRSSTLHSHGLGWVALSLFFVSTVLLSSTQAQEDFKVVYPDSKATDHVDTIHGVDVADPFRWLEDSETDAGKTWIREQNELTDGILDQMPEVDKLRERMTALWDFERVQPPRQAGGQLFFLNNDGLQDQNILMVADSLEEEPTILLNPNDWSDEGTTTLADWEPSPDGKLLAYALGFQGSDWRELHVINVDSKEVMEDKVNWAKFTGIAWAPDSSGFYYSRYDEPDEKEALTGVNYFHKLYFHKLGTPQSEDKLVYSRDDEKDWGFSGEVSEDGKYLMIQVWKGTLSQNQVFYAPLSEGKTPGPDDVVEMLTGYEVEYGFVESINDEMVFLTDHQAPRRRVVSIDPSNPDPKDWTEIIPESDNAIVGCRQVGKRLIVQYLRNASSYVRVFTFTGEHLADVDMAGIGIVDGFSGGSDVEETYYSFENFTTPPTIYRYDLESFESVMVKQPQLQFNPDDFETVQVFGESKDGTPVPIFLTYKKNFKQTGNTPTLLYGYGGFDIPITPRFSVSNLAWIEAGGLYAVATLRGGGEFGREWHEAGMYDKKQNVFDDFIAAAEYLVEEGYTKPENLAISGRSNGGLLVGAVMCQRPELFGAALPGVGVMDMLRFHKFTIGYAWVSEYGSAEDPEQFKTLYAYSPLHNLKQGTKYPATLVLTADHDDRVVPAHSFKFAARLQQCQASDGPPCLIRIETSGGHGAGKPVSMQIDEAADSLGFIANRTGLDVQPPN